MAEKKVTLKEIAQRTGVSLGTVHRAIYGKTGISEETRRRILAEVKRSNYQIDEAASVLKRSAKKVVVVLPKAQKEDRFYFQGIWEGIHRAAQGMEQFKIYFKFIESDFPLSQIWIELERVYDDMLEEIDGLITISDSDKANVWIGRFAKRGISTVLLSSYYEGEGEDGVISCIKVEHERSGRLAAEFLNYCLKGKGGKILILCGDSYIYSNRIYSASFAREMKNYGYETIEVEGFGRAEIEGACLRQLEKTDVKAIFSSNARNTYSICKILESRQQEQELLLVGTDMFEELVPYFESGILNAVVCQYHWEQGERAVKKIYEALSRGIRDQEDETLPTVLVMKSNYPCFI